MITKRQVSAGGIVYRKNGDRIEVAIAARDGSKIWCLPKGIVEKGETIEEAARREVEEETGLKGKLIEKISRIEYWFYWKSKDTRYHKFVHFFLMEHVGGDVSRHDFELDEIRWMGIDKALKMLTYEGERQVMEKAKQMLENPKGDQCQNI